MVGVTMLTWIPALASKSIGLVDIIPNIFRTAERKIFSLDGNGLSIIAFAFLIYALLESKAIQDFFTSSRQEKWKKRRNWVIVSLTITASLMSTFLFWYDEYIHFFPLVIPLFLAMGLDGFSSFLCLFGGATAGILSAVSPIRLNSLFRNVNAFTENRTEFKGASGIEFRLVSWLIFTAIIVLFNIWYCNKIYHQNYLQKPKKLPEVLPSKIESKKKTTSKIRWIVIAVFGFFLVGSILGSIPWFAGDKDDKGWKNGWRRKKTEEELKQEELNREKSGPKWTASYNSGLVNRIEDTGETYEKKGTMDEEILTGNPEDKGKQRDIATVTTNVTEPFWPKFGAWDELQLCSWFVIGAIIICLLSKQNIANTLITTAQKTIPIIIGYILMSTTVTIVKDSGMHNKLKTYLLSLFSLVFDEIFFQ